MVIDGCCGEKWFFLFLVWLKESGVGVERKVEWEEKGGWWGGGGEGGVEGGWGGGGRGGGGGGGRRGGGGVVINERGNTEI